MRSKNKLGFTLIELQIASILMIVVLIATGIIFYFCLASIRYIHDAVMVYSNANAAMKTLSNEIMVSNCWGYEQVARVGGHGINTPQYSFYGALGYIHGLDTDFDEDGIYERHSGVPAGSLSEEEALNCFPEMPLMGDGADILYLRQPSQEGNASTAGDFPAHDSMAIYLWANPDGINEMHVNIERNGGYPNTVGQGEYVIPVAHHITDFSFQEIAFNCLAVSVTATGTVADPLAGSASGQYYEISLHKMITLRCAPTVRPWLE